MFVPRTLVATNGYHFLNDLSGKTTSDRFLFDREVKLETWNGSYPREFLFFLSFSYSISCFLLNFDFCYLPYYSSFRDEVVVLDARSVLSLADIKSPSEELYKREAAGRIVIGETDIEYSDILTA